MKIAKNITDLIGNTPMLELNRFMAATGTNTGARILAKLEYFNPQAASRTAWVMQ